jgi:hypothetical protein
VPQLARSFLRSRSIMPGDGPGNPVLQIVLIGEVRFKPNLAAASFGRESPDKFPSEGECAFVEFVVKLREVEVVGLKTTQRLFQHSHGERTVAAVSADLGHDKGFVTPPFEAQAQPGLSFAAIIFPGIVVEGDAPWTISMTVFSSFVPPRW